MIPTIQKRLTALEQAEQHPDPVRKCLEVLNDEQLSCLLEFSELKDSGFDGADIPGMMQERWDVVMEAKAKMEKRYRELTEPSRAVRIAEAP